MGVTVFSGQIGEQVILTDNLYRVVALSAGLREEGVKSTPGLNMLQMTQIAPIQNITMIRRKVRSLPL